MAKKKPESRDDVWAAAARKYRLSPDHVRMAKELGLNPKKLGKMAPNPQERWKEPLPEFIEGLHQKRFSR